MVVALVAGVGVDDDAVAGVATLFEWFVPLLPWDEGGCGAF